MKKLINFSKHRIWVVLFIIGTITYMLTTANPDDPHVEQWHSFVRKAFIASILTVAIFRYALGKIPIANLLMKGLGLKEGQDGEFILTSEENPHFGLALITLGIMLYAIYDFFGQLLAGGL